MWTQETGNKSNYERMIYLLPIFRWDIVYTVQCAYALQRLWKKFEDRYKQELSVIIGHSIKPVKQLSTNFTTFQVISFWAVKKAKFSIEYNRRTILILS